MWTQFQEKKFRHEKNKNERLSHSLTVRCGGVCTNWINNRKWYCLGRPNGLFECVNGWKIYVRLLELAKALWSKIFISESSRESSTLKWMENSTWIEKWKALEENFPSLAHSFNWAWKSFNCILIRKSNFFASTRSISIEKCHSSLLESIQDIFLSLPKHEESVSFQQQIASAFAEASEVNNFLSIFSHKLSISINFFFLFWIAIFHFLELKMEIFFSSCTRNFFHVHQINFLIKFYSVYDGRKF